MPAIDARPPSLAHTALATGTSQIELLDVTVGSLQVTCSRLGIS
jgi:hypothetical protein